MQVVALTDRAAATAVVQRLSGKGYPAFMVTPQAGAPVQNYKVQVGRYNDRAEAEQIKASPQEGRTVRALDRLALALLSGALLALSFPKFGHPAFAWVALTPLIVALVRQPSVPARASRRAFFLGLPHRRGLLRRHALLAGRDDDDVRRAADAARGVRRGARSSRTCRSFPRRSPSRSIDCARRRHARSRCCCAAPVWVATELGRQYVWDGFPWALLGYSQVRCCRSRRSRASPASTACRGCWR